MNYPYIRAWGLHAGQWRDYIDRQVEMAIEENAPPTAIYRDDGRWVCIEDIQHKATRDKVFRRVQSLTAK
jgi:hypothetical protein